MGPELEPGELLVGLDRLNGVGNAGDTCASCVDCSVEIIGERDGEHPALRPNSRPPPRATRRANIGGPKPTKLPNHQRSLVIGNPDASCCVRRAGDGTGRLKSLGRLLVENGRPYRDRLELALMLGRGAPWRMVGVVA
jgi:hypothetical protein